MKLIKRNAILVAGILFAGAAAQAQNSDYGASSSSRLDTSDAAVSGTENLDRRPNQAVIPITPVDPSNAQQHDPAAAGSYEAVVSGSDDHSTEDDGSDVSADSSIRGGSIEARGYDQDANNDEIEPPAEPINPGKQADSSIRGGSVGARERDWNDDSEPSSGRLDPNRRMKADSSIRGGSIEARGGREARGDFEDSGFEGRTRDDFGQGSSATWESDKSHGSVRGSANWNASDDMLRDGIDAEAQRTRTYEFNNDASVGGSARGESGEGRSTSGDLELNSSDQIEENISGEFQLDATGEKDRPASPVPPQSSVDPNSGDVPDNSTTSLRSTDIVHDDADGAIHVETEASGAAAESEVGSSSSSDKSEFKSNDPALNSYNSPLGSSGNEPNFIHEDNPANGVGSLGTGNYGGAAAAQSGHAASISDDQLAEKVKGTLTRESTGAHGLMRHEVARNVQVSANAGEVTLKGAVPSEKDKQMLEIRAREITGVQRIDNQLTVTPEADSANRDRGIGHDLEDTTDQLQN